MRALVIDLRYNDRRAMLVKPQTYMNDSGIAVGSLLKFYKIPRQNILVAHDDVDLPFGTIRLRPGGSSAGQKGVASIIDRLGTQDFARLRLGVGRPPGSKLAAGYVLQNFNRDESEILPVFLDKAVDAALTFLTETLDKGRLLPRPRLILPYRFLRQALHPQKLHPSNHSLKSPCYLPG